MNKTKIEWVKNPDGSPGYTWNPITGCLNGCTYCYARKLANGRLKERYLANKNPAPGMNVSDEIWQLDPFYPRFWEERVLDLTTHRIRHHARDRRGVFVCDMSDLFGIGIPEEWTERVFDAISSQMTYPAENDHFYLLTKQPQNLPKWSPFPDNCWVGVTATSFEHLGRALYIGLARIEAKGKFISFEPLLGETQLKAIDLTDCGINWLIIGAQTNPYKPPKIEWVQEIVEAADKAGTLVFLKDNLKPLLAPKRINQNIFWKDKRDAKGFEELHLELRQEMPKCLK